MNVSLVSLGLRGNTTKLRQQTSRNRSRSWCFTINNYDRKLFVSLSQPFFFPQKIEKLIFQEEVGLKKTKHLQGFVRFKNQVEFTNMKKWLPTAHIEKTRSVAGSIKYCSKEATRAGERYTYGISDDELNKPVKPMMTQSEILEHMKLQLKEERVKLMKEGKCCMCEEKIPCKCPEF